MYTNDMTELRSMMDAIADKIVGRARATAVSMTVDSRGNVRVSLKLTATKYFPTQYNGSEVK